MFLIYFSQNIHIRIIYLCALKSFAPPAMAGPRFAPPGWGGTEPRWWTSSWRPAHWRGWRGPRLVTGRPRPHTIRTGLRYCRPTESRWLDWPPSIRGWGVPDEAEEVGGLGEDGEVEEDEALLHGGLPLHAGPLRAADHRYNKGQDSEQPPSLLCKRFRDLWWIRILIWCLQNRRLKHLCFLKFSRSCCNNI